MLMPLYHRMGWEVGRKRYGGYSGAVCKFLFDFAVHSAGILRAERELSKQEISR